MGALRRSAGASVDLEGIFRQGSGPGLGRAGEVDLDPAAGQLGDKVRGDGNADRAALVRGIDRHPAGLAEAPLLSVVTDQSQPNIAVDRALARAGKVHVDARRGFASAQRLELNRGDGDAGAMVPLSDRSSGCLGWRINISELPAPVFRVRYLVEILEADT